MIVLCPCCFDHRQKIAAASNASRKPINGLKTANQKETRQPESWTIAFVFMLFSQAFEEGHFRGSVKPLRYAFAAVQSKTGQCPFVTAPYCRLSENRTRWSSRATP